MTSRAVSAGRPRPSAAAISRMGIAKAATGWSAISATRRAAPCSCGCKDVAKGPAGNWLDAATGEHGDLLDVIRESRGLVDFKDVADEARSFLSLPRAQPPAPQRPSSQTPSATAGSPERRDACSPCHDQSQAHSQKRISAIAALRLCTEPETCASTRAAITGPTSTARPKPGRR